MEKNKRTKKQKKKMGIGIIKIKPLPGQTKDDLKKEEEAFARIFAK